MVHRTASGHRDGVEAQDPERLLPLGGLDGDTVGATQAERE